MANHKWESIESRTYAQKSDKCLKCGMERYWAGGDMQGWNYLDLQSVLGTQRTTWCRPDCNPDRDMTQGFDRNGNYMY